MTSYKLVAQCWCKCHAITAGSISSHHNYGERMGLSFNEEIQSRYNQNTSVSVDGKQHMHYFGHWLDDPKQDTAATIRNMRNELCIDGNLLNLVEGLSVGGMVWKGTDSVAVS